MTIGRSFRALFLFALLAAGACTVFKRTSEPISDMSYLYRPDQYAFYPRYTIYHDGADQSTVFGRIRTGDLLFSQANVNVQFQAELRIHYRLFEMGDYRVLADSMSLDYVLVKEEVGNDYYFNFTVPARTGKKYMLEVITTDVVRDRAVQNFIVLDKTSPYGAQNFLAVNGFTGKPFFREYVDSTTVLRLICNDPSVDTLFLSIYRDNYAASRPPNLLLPPERINFLPDTTYPIPITPGTIVVFPEQAIYHFRIDTNRMEGLTFMRFTPGFPLVDYAEEMIGPLEYIATPNDYNQLITQPNRKLSVDNFWIGLTGNLEQARELIRIYYTRVYFSNYYFTSYKEGWKTERGMIYMIYGPPSLMYKTDMTEEWIYGKEGSKDALRFVFRREDNPFTHNHYVLLRSEELNTYWSLAMESWRAGRIFYVQDVQ